MVHLQATVPKLRTEIALVRIFAVGLAFETLRLASRMRRALDQPVVERWRHG
jgi:hypothetical protein